MHGMNYSIDKPLHVLKDEFHQEDTAVSLNYCTYLMLHTYMIHPSEQTSQLLGRRAPGSNFSLFSSGEPLQAISFKRVNNKNCWVSGTSTVSEATIFNELRQSFKS
jgi:hypothetical protein